jgi:hypothetical protein
MTDSPLFYFDNLLLFKRAAHVFQDKTTWDVASRGLTGSKVSILPFIFSSRMGIACIAVASTTIPTLLD